MDSTELDARLEPVLAIARENAEAVDTDGVFPEEAVAELRRSGLLGLALPTEIGGLGQGPAVFSDVVQRLAAACGSTAMVYIMHVAAAVTVAAAPPAAHPDMVADLATGRSLATLGFSERGSRSHFWAPVSRKARCARATGCSSIWASLWNGWTPSRRRALAVAWS